MPRLNWERSRALRERTSTVVQAATVSRRRKPIKIDDLPPPGITRWVIHRKAQVVAAVQAGALSLEEVCARYSVSVEEFQSWQKTLQRHGIYGLRTTRSQIYRSGESKINGNGKG